MPTSTPSPVYLSAIEQILNSPPAIVSAITVVVTLILFVLNIYISRKNLQEEYNRKIDINFYDLTIIKSLTNIFEFISCVKKCFSNLKESYNANESTNILIENCQRNLKLIDESYEGLENNSLIFFNAFSTKKTVDIMSVTETYYDACTEIFSRFSANSLTNRNTAIIGGQFNEITLTYLKNTHQAAKESAPS